MTEVILTLPEPIVSKILETSTIPILLFFTGPDCSACKMFEPNLQRVANERSNKLKIIKVDCSEDPNLASRYNVRSLPTLILFSKAVLMNYKIGVSTYSDLINFLNVELY